MTKTAKIKTRILKNRRKAETVGIFYLIGTLLLAAAAFFPMLYGTSVGSLWVANFWKPFADFGKFKGSAMPVLLNGAVAVVYALMLLTVVVNLIRSLACLSMLYKKKPTRMSGFNRNAKAMDKMGRIFSGTYCVVIVFPFIIHLISGAAFANLFWIALIVGAILHFWLGAVGGNVSLFTVGENPVEIKRQYGRVAPFLRNLAQFVFAGLIMVFLSRGNLILNLLNLIGDGKFSAVFKGDFAGIFVQFILPLAQILLAVWAIVLVNHATGVSELRNWNWDKDYDVNRDVVTEAVVWYPCGRKVFRVMSVLTLVTALAAFVPAFIARGKDASVQPSMSAVYIAVIALAALIEEICTCKLPNVKGKVYVEGETSPTEESAAKDEDGEVEIDFDAPAGTEAAKETAGEGAAHGAEYPAYPGGMPYISQPMIFMQPNGQPVMLVPFVDPSRLLPPPAGAAQPNAPYGYGYGYNYPNAYYGGNYRPYDPYHYAGETGAQEVKQETAAETPAAEENVGLSVEERKARLAEEKKSLRTQAAVARKTHSTSLDEVSPAAKMTKEELALARREAKLAADRAAIEDELTRKWIGKAKQKPAEEKSEIAAPASDESVVSQDVAAESPAPAVPEKPAEESAPVLQMPAAPAVNKEEESAETYGYRRNEETKEEVSLPEADSLTEEDLSKPLPPKKWQVTCPDCMIKLSVTEGAFAYRCPECGGVFRLRKVYRARKNEENNE